MLSPPWESSMIWVLAIITVVVENITRTGSPEAMPEESPPPEKPSSCDTSPLVC
jgi:hypothetical protein